MTDNEQPSSSHEPARLLIIGAGARGTSYSRALSITRRHQQATGQSPKGLIVGTAEPHDAKRRQFVESFVSNPNPSLIFSDWKDFVFYLESRFNNAKRAFEEDPGVDAVAICTLDHMHEPIVLALRKFHLHIMCEKPLSTTLNSTLSVTRAISDPTLPPVLFLVCHVLRYSQHNMLLRKLLVEDKVIGDVVNVDWTEPVGYWHFAHSYVRGNWNNVAESAPSLLTKCCHDLDMVLWLVGFPSGHHYNSELKQPKEHNRVTDGVGETPPQQDQQQQRKRGMHLPSKIYSNGTLTHFRPANKPHLAKAANSTNCFSCPAERECIYSAKRLYLDHHLRQLNTGWPVKIVVPDIEDIMSSSGWDSAESALINALKEDYDPKQGPQEGKKYYGRCVYEANNDVCDNQVVVLTWDPDDSTSQGKMATIRMVANTDAICERRGRIAGTLGEITFDTAGNGQAITVRDFRKFPGEEGYRKIYRPTGLYDPQNTGGHGGGDKGIVDRFVNAVWEVKNGICGVDEAQEGLGMTWEECEVSHACVWAAEESRKRGSEVRFQEWYRESVEEWRKASVALKN